MLKLEYFWMCVDKKLTWKMDWLVRCFSLTRENTTPSLSETYAFQPSRQTWGYQFVNDQGAVIKIDDAAPNEPLFNFKDDITINPKNQPNITSEEITKIGNVIFNEIVILPSFGKAFPFQLGKLDIKKQEALIASRLTETPDDPSLKTNDKLYIDDYIKWRDNLIFMEQLAPLTNWSVTKKGITRSKEHDVLKAKLIKEYGDRLKDPVIYAEFEMRLKDFDKEWLKDDPAYGTFLSGKILNISRKKLQLTIGVEEVMDPTDPTTPVVASLSDGIPTKPDEFTAIINGARSGSFSRGSETVNGGVVSKGLIRVGSGFKILDKDCGTTVGLETTYYEGDENQLLHRYIIVNNQNIFIKDKEMAKQYLNKPIKVRALPYCKEGPKDLLCRYCAGERLFPYKEGLVIPLTEKSHIILSTSLKSMHGTVLSTVKVNLSRTMS